MQGLLRVHQDRLHEGIITDLPHYGGSSFINFERWVQNLEKKPANITNYDSLWPCYA